MAGKVGTPEVKTGMQNVKLEERNEQMQVVLLRIVHVSGKTTAHCVRGSEDTGWAKNKLPNKDI